MRLAHLVSMSLFTVGVAITAGGLWLLTSRGGEHASKLAFNTETCEKYTAAMQAGQDTDSLAAAFCAMRDEMGLFDPLPFQVMIGAGVVLILAAFLAAILMRPATQS